MNIIITVVLSGLALYYLATWRMKKIMEKDNRFMIMYYPTFILYILNRDEIDKHLQNKLQYPDAKSQEFYNRFRAGHRFTHEDLEKAYNAGADFGIHLYKHDHPSKFKNFKHFFDEQ